jgi:enoyl-CoA hydratase
VTDHLLLEKEGHLALVTVNRPDVMNALNSDVLDELDGVVADLEADDQIRCVILTGAGDKAFIAGADIGELKELTGEAAKEIALKGQRVFARIEAMDKPVIAAINGFALGGGLELALACTLRTAATTARVGLPEVSLGILPGYGGSQRLARIAGPGVAREWIITAEMYDASEAHRVGVVNRLYEPADLMDGTRKMAEGILARGPIAVRAALEAIRRGMQMSQEEGSRIEADLFGLVSSSEDKAEGMAAFLEKRKPEFKDR